VKRDGELRYDSYGYYSSPAYGKGDRRGKDGRKGRKGDARKAKAVDAVKAIRTGKVTGVAKAVEGNRTEAVDMVTATKCGYHRRRCTAPYATGTTHLAGYTANMKMRHATRKAEAWEHGRLQHQRLHRRAEATQPPQSRLYSALFFQFRVIFRDCTR
jgi:hypothetical protein